MKQADSKLHPYFLSVHVMLYEPLAELNRDPASGRGQIISGYIVNVGVSALNKDEAACLVEQAVGVEGTVDWRRCSWKELDTVNPTILSKHLVAKTPQIWYKSGRAFFS